jgi:predicted RNase H-like HicB family nuclease
MLTKYIRTAMRQATYEILSDGTFYGEISGFQGVYANANTLEACREQLQEVLEGWIILGLRMGHTLPVVDGIELAIELEAI